MAKLVKIINEQNHNTKGMMQMILNLKNKEKYIKVDYETSYILQTKVKAIPIGRDKDFVYFNNTEQLRKDIANNDLQIRC